MKNSKKYVIITKVYEWSSAFLERHEHFNIHLLKGENKMSNIIDALEKEGMRTDLPAFNIGDTVKVWVKVVEGNRERLQGFEGVVIARKNGGIRETFTVRKISYGVGVERTFPMHSPKIDHIDIVRRGEVRRAKLYYLRERTGKAAKVKEAKLNK